MANSHSLITKSFKSMKSKTLLTTLSSLSLSSISIRHSSTSAAQHENSTDSPSSFTFSSDGVGDNNSSIYVRAPPSMSDRRSASSVTMPMSFMTGSIVGKRFYKKVTTREADDGVGWTVMLDYRTLKTPSKRPLKLPTLALAKAIAAEWEYQMLEYPSFYVVGPKAGYSGGLCQGTGSQHKALLKFYDIDLKQTDGIRPFTMPLMKLACTALERVPLTRTKVIEHLMKKFHQDLVFCRAPDDNDLTSYVHDRQVEKFNPLLRWVESEFGVKPVVYSSFFGGKQEDGLVKAVENLLNKTDDCELAAIDAIAAAAHSLIVSVALVRGKVQIEEAIELIRLEEDLQVERWGLVEGGHDVDIADLRVQVSSAAVFLGLSRRT